MKGGNCSDVARNSKAQISLIEINAMRENKTPPTPLYCTLCSSKFCEFMKINVVESFKFWAFEKFSPYVGIAGIAPSYAIF